MKIIVPSMKFVTIPPWGFRVIHNETHRDLEVSITHDDLQNDHIIINDPSQAEKVADKAASKKGD